MKFAGAPPRSPRPFRRNSLVELLAPERRHPRSLICFYPPPATARLPSPRQHRPQHAAHTGQRNRPEVARVPTPQIVETEQPDLTWSDAAHAPCHVIERALRAVARRRPAVREDDCVDRDPTRLDLDRVTRNRADNLRDRLGSRRTIALAEIAAREPRPRDRGRNTGRDKLAPCKRNPRDQAVDACRRGAVR